MNEGKVYYISAFFSKEKYETLQRLNESKYYLENLIANYQHGNVIRYISKQNNKTIYEVTDNIRHKHIIYGSKCSA